MADVGVGGGASKTLACVFWIVRDSVDSEGLVIAADLCIAGKDNAEVWRDSLGLLGAAGRDDGMTDSIAPATCLRSSDMWGGESLCLGGREGLKESLLWRLGFGSCERIGKMIMTAASSKDILGGCWGNEGVELKTPG